jgi:polyferredoxin
MDFLNPVLDDFEGLVRGAILPVEQPAFAQNIAIAGLFFGLVALNLLAHRFWCRYLCPLGALLGILARFSLFRPVIGSGCTECKLCARSCKVGAIETKADDFHIVAQECTVCLDCLAAGCKRMISASVSIKPAQERPMTFRREALIALGSGSRRITVGHRPSLAAG